MSTVALHLTVRQWAGEPDRRVRLDVPVDVPLAALLDDFVDAAEEHAFQCQLEFDAQSDGWRLQLPDGSSPNGECVAELGISELALYDSERVEPPFEGKDAPEACACAGQGADADDLPTPAEPSVPKAPDTRRSPRRGRSGQRIVRARAEATLPRRMGTVARTVQALSALSSSYDVREARDLGLNDPARFMREHRKPAVRRVREAWWSTDYQRLLEAMILLPAPPTCRTVAVLSPKGGVGKTTITGLLGMLLSFVRRTVTVAVDANPDMSNLSAALSPGRGKLIDELLKSSLADERCTPMDVLGELGNGPHGLRVAPSPNDPERALDKQSYLLLYKRLKAVAEVLVLDCGTGLIEPAAQAALETADQLVVVVDGAPDAMAMVASGECQRLLRAFSGPIFLVVNKLTRRDRRQINLGEFETELSFAQGIVEVAYDEEAASRLSTFRWDDRPPADWAIRIRELGALIATSWPA